MLFENYFSGGSFDQDLIFDVAGMIVAIAIVGSTFISPPKNGWMGLLLNGFSLFKIREKSSAIFHLSLLGSSHNVVYTPALIRTFAQLRSVVDFTSIKWMIFNGAFGVPAQYRDAYVAASDELDACIAKYLLREPYMSKMSWAVISRTYAQLKNLVTLEAIPASRGNNGVDADSKSGLKPWELHASVTRIENRNPSVEVSFFPLLTSFLGHMTLPVMMGSAYVGNSPNALEDMGIVDDSFLALIVGLPRWLPTSKEGYEARDRLHQGLASLYHALDMEAEGQLSAPYGDLSDVSELIRSFDKIWKRIGLSVDARAAAGLGLPWALTMNANNLVCWLLLRILATPGLADEIRRETKRFFRDGNAPCDTTLPLLEGSGKGDLGRWCPLLKACYLETVRLDSEIVSVRKIRRDNLVPETETASTSAFRLKSGDYLHAFHYLHHTDPKHFEEPERFKPERFLIRQAGSVVVSQGTLRPYGAGVSMCKGRVVAERVCMHMVAGLLQNWEFEPAGFGWKIPGHISAAGICKPSEDVRVHVSRRIYVERRPNVERRATVE